MRECYTLTDSEMTIFLDRSPSAPTYRRTAICSDQTIDKSQFGGIANAILVHDTHALGDVEERVEPVEKEQAPDVGRESAQELAEVCDDERQQHERRRDQVGRGPRAGGPELDREPAFAHSVSFGRSSPVESATHWRRKGSLESTKMTRRTSTRGRKVAKKSRTAAATSSTALLQRHQLEMHEMGTQPSLHDSSAHSSAPVLAASEMAAGASVCASAARMLSATYAAPSASAARVASSGSRRLLRLMSTMTVVALKLGMTVLPAFLYRQRRKETEKPTFRCMKRCSIQDACC